ncbi:M28 family peptidase [Sediminitomix flava]|uniref:Peptidase M28-like protein n=1 Tax=Sediminitomix flava TaxID=379075 RepID=A0A315ZBQ9_SEDFL|nr:M28 family peptidase [Sediminitomix flava]PWJ42742.1 peptidase M28-like protein [Sediminitomix flava]
MKKYTSILFALAILAVSCKTNTKIVSQDKSSSFTQKSEKLLQKYQETITANDLKEHLYVIASDEMEGRDTGSEGQKKAASYIVDKLKKMNLEGPVKTGDPYQQEIPFIQRSTKSVTFSRGNKNATLYNDFYAWGHFNYKADSVELVYVGNGLPETLSQFDLKGKAIIFNSKLPKNFEGDKKWENPINRVKNASENGVVFSMVIRPTDKEFKKELKLYRSYLERPQLVYEQEVKSASNSGIYVTGPTLATMLFDGKLPQENGNSTKVLFEAIANQDKLESSNILGYLEGSDKKDELVVITSHYDHVGIINGKIHNGADDDGSGTVSLLEIAEAFTEASKDGFKPRRSILFMSVTGEERGLLGSKYYTDFDPIFSLDQTVTNINIDMVGRFDEKHKDANEYIYVIGSDMLSSELHTVQEDANERFGNGLVLDYTYNKKDSPERYYYRSDHYNFAKNNIPVIFYFSGVHEDYHQPTDTPDKIEYELMAKRAQMIFATAWKIVNRDTKVKVDKVDTEKSK